MIDHKLLIEEFTTKFESGFGPSEFFVNKQETDIRHLKSLYLSLPKRFPKLFEDLVRNYRWCNATVENLKLLDNPSGNDFSGFLEEIMADKQLSEVCLSSNFIQIGQLADSYDPVCFDCNKGSSRRNYHVVVLDHERILINSQVKVTSTLAKSFEELLLSIDR